MNYLIITCMESIYLFYMYFLYKTDYNLSIAVLDKAVNKLGPFFVHNSSCYCNKICPFGKFMAMVSIVLGFIRLKYLDNPKTVQYSLVYGFTCLLMAFLMNMDAFVYLIPLVITELILIKSLYDKQRFKYCISNKEPNKH